MKEINLNHICKIEGHASLSLKIENNQVKVCELEALEGARFFEALVLNKKVEDIQEIVSRICGICSSSHSVCAIQALENALGIHPTKNQKIVREMLMIGERMRSHATHLYFLALPDYYDKASALELGPEHKEKIDTALRLISLGNKIVESFGGREMHPFMKFKDEALSIDLEPLIKQLKESHEMIMSTINLFYELKYHGFERSVDYLCLNEKNHYTIISGNIVSNIDKFSVSDYKKHLTETIKEYATSKFVLHDNKPYMLGALARINNNHNTLDPETKKVLNYILKDLKLNLPINNPYYNNLCQAIELLQCKNRALELIKDFSKDSIDARDLKIKPGTGISAVEAPRGTLFHEYKIDNTGKITYCNIITPTCQNLNIIEHDITILVNNLLKKGTTKEIIVKEIERLIRSFDPCFSCSTHFLKVNWL